MKNKVLLAASLLALSVSFACSKKDGPKIDPKATGELSDLPVWVLDPSVKDGVGGVGIAAPSKGGLTVQIAKAELDAKGNIASRIRSEISRVTKNALRSAKVNENDDVEEFFAQATKDVVKDLPLSGVKRINIYKGKDGTLYVHMVLTAEDYSKFLDNSEKAFEANLKKSGLSRGNINKTQEATQSLFDELEKERDSGKPVGASKESDSKSKSVSE